MNAFKTIALESAAAALLRHYYDRMTGMVPMQAQFKVASETHPDLVKVVKERSERWFKFLPSVSLQQIHELVGPNYQNHRLYQAYKLMFGRSDFVSFNREQW